jgi:hypothetical protein
MRQIAIAFAAHIGGAFVGVTVGVALLEWTLFLAGVEAEPAAYLVAGAIGGGAGVFFGHLSWMFWKE